MWKIEEKYAVQDCRQSLCLTVVHGKLWVYNPASSSRFVCCDGISLAKSFTLVACNLAELCFWTTLPLLQDWSAAGTFHTKCSKAEKDAGIVIHLIPLGLVKLVPQLMVSCCFALSEHPHFVSVRRGAVRCPVWGFLCVVSCVNSFSKLCGWNWRIKFHDPPGSFVGLVGIAPAWNVCAAVMVKCQWYPEMNLTALQACSFIHAEAHGQVINNPHLFSWGAVSASLFPFFLFSFWNACLVCHSTKEQNHPVLEWKELSITFFFLKNGIINNLPPYNFTKDR